MSTLYHFHVQIAKFGTRKTCFKTKSQKHNNIIILVNNCHLYFSQYNSSLTLTDTYSMDVHVANDYFLLGRRLTVTSASSSATSKQGTYTIDGVFSLFSPACMHTCTCTYTMMKPHLKGKTASTNPMYP
jgi:hypothetical protein